MCQVRSKNWGLGAVPAIFGNVILITEISHLSFLIIIKLAISITGLQDGHTRMCASERSVRILKGCGGVRNMNCSCKGHEFRV